MIKLLLQVALICYITSHSHKYKAGQSGTVLLSQAVNNQLYAKRY